MSLMNVESRYGPNHPFGYNKEKNDFLMYSTIEKPAPTNRDVRSHRNGFSKIKFAALIISDIWEILVSGL